MMRPCIITTHEYDTLCGIMLYLEGYPSKGSLGSGRGSLSCSVRLCHMYYIYVMAEIERCVSSIDMATKPKVNRTYFVLSPIH